MRTERVCANPECNGVFIPYWGQEYCDAKCRRRAQHLRRLEKYPEERHNKLPQLQRWKAGAGVLPTEIVDELIERAKFDLGKSTLSSKGKRNHGT